MRNTLIGHQQGAEKMNENLQHMQIQNFENAEGLNTTVRKSFNIKARESSSWERSKMSVFTSKR